VEDMIEFLLIINFCTLYFTEVVKAFLIASKLLGGCGRRVVPNLFESRF
jgi:hypothetical protein